MVLTITRIVSTLFLCITFYSNAQILIKGVVSDSKEALAGVTVIEKGTTNGTVTDIDGKFSLTVKDTNSVLSFSYMGYKVKTVVAKTNANFTIVLEEEIKQIEEVIVTAIAIKKEKRELGFAVQEVKSQEILDAKETNLVNALNSKVAGVQVVSSSGSPGAAARIRLRGSTSITQNNDPLFVVDGIPIDNTGGERTRDIESSNRAVDINPDDVASMTILKGPAATALYGIRAANGAVIITTKSGQSGKTTVSFSSSVGIDQVNKLPQLQTKYAGGQNGVFIPFESRTGKPASAAWGPAYGDSSLPTGVQFYDNPSAFFTTGFQRNNHISVSGGSEKSTSYFSIGNFRQTGVVPNQDFERTSLKLTNATQVAKFLKITGSINYNLSTATRLRKGGNWSAPMISLYRGASDFDITGGYKDPLDTPDAYLTADGLKQKTASVYDNPFFSVNKNKSTEAINRIVGFVQADLTLTPWLTGMARIGADVFNQVITENYDKRSAENHAQQSFKGSYYESQQFKQDFNSDLMLNAQHKVGKDFEVGLRLGQNFWTSKSTTLGLQGFNYLFNDFYDFNALDVSGSPLQLSPTSRNSQRSLLAAYVDGKVSYKNYLFVNFTTRLEKSSTLPINNNTYLFPTVNVALIFSDLLGITNKKWFSYGKIRAAFGQVGNLPYPYLTTNYFGSVLSGGFNGQNLYANAGSLGNPNFKPELSTTQEYGIELKFFKNRLGLDATYYNTLNSNQIVLADISPTSGFGSAWLNRGTIRNTGLEIVLNGTPIKTTNFSWDASVNFTSNRTIVEDLSGGFQFVGGGAGFNNGSNGVLPNNQYGIITSPQRFKRYGQDPNDLTIRKDLPIEVDSLGNPLLQSAPRGYYIIGNPNPKWFAGLRNSFTYKGLYFSFLWDFRSGGDLINLTRGSMNYFGTHKDTENREQATVLENSVKSDGSANTTPVLKNAAFYNRLGENATVGELWIESGSWVRLREVTLRYSFGENITKKLFMKNLSLALTMRNLFLFTSYSGIDPETNAAGNDPSLGKDAYNMPNTRSFLLTLNATF